MTHSCLCSSSNTASLHSSLQSRIPLAAPASLPSPSLPLSDPPSPFPFPFIGFGSSSRFSRSCFLPQLILQLRDPLPHELPPGPSSSCSAPSGHPLQLGKHVHHAPALRATPLGRASCARTQSHTSHNVLSSLTFFIRPFRRFLKVARRAA